MQYTDTWNDDVVRAAYSNDTPLDKKPYIVYAASKTEGERSAWKWVAENKPGFEFNVVIPNVNVSEKFRLMQINRQSDQHSPWAVRKDLDARGNRQHDEMGVQSLAWRPVCDQSSPAK